MIALKIVGIMGRFAPRLWRFSRTPANCLSADHFDANLCQQGILNFSIDNQKVKGDVWQIFMARYPMPNLCAMNLEKWSCILCFAMPSKIRMCRKLPEAVTESQNRRKTFATLDAEEGPRRVMENRPVRLFRS
jgi:hypothetical protein